MIDLSNVAIGARCEDRVGGASNFLTRRSQDAHVRGIGDEFRIRVGGRVPLLFTRARRRSIADSAYVICRGVSATRVFVGLFRCFYDVFGVNDVQHVSFNFRARYFSFFYYVLYVLVSGGVYGYGVYSFEDGFWDGDFAGAADHANRGNYFSVWWSRAGFGLLVGFYSV